MCSTSGLRSRIKSATSLKPNCKYDRSSVESHPGTMLNHRRSFIWTSRHLSGYPSRKLLRPDALEDPLRASACRHRRGVFHPPRSGPYRRLSNSFEKRGVDTPRNGGVIRTCLLSEAMYQTTPLAV